MGEHLPLERAHRGGRVHAELLDQGRAQRAQRLQGIGLALAAVEGEREQRPQPLPERMVADHARQQAVRLLRPAEGQERLGPALHQRQPGLLEADRLGGERGRVPETGERLTPPQAEHTGRRVEDLRRLQAGQPLGEPGNGDGVHVRADEGVARGVTAHLGVFAEDPAEPGDRDLQRVGCRGGRFVAPELVDQAVVADVAPRCGGEQRQQHPLAPTADGAFLVPDPETQRPEHVDGDGHGALLPRVHAA